MTSDPPLPNAAHEERCAECPLVVDRRVFRQGDELIVNIDALRRANDDVAAWSAAVVEVA
ncbi:MAG: hypothetical protein ACREOJ_13490 [Gemmatimonadaceae bacterium]